MFYKTIEDNILVAIGTSSKVSSPSVEITLEEYKSILNLIKNKPQDTEEVVYKLVGSTMTYEPFDAPPKEEIVEPNNSYGLSNEVYDNIYDDIIYDLIEQGLIG